jgi:molybdate transport system regulatory protein
MVNMRVAVRFDLETGERIGSREITLLEAIQTQGSITGAARSLGISYRGAWLRVRQINQALREPAVSGGPGGRSGGGAAVTPVGMTLIAVYHAVEAKVQRVKKSTQFASLHDLARRPREAFPKALAHLWRRCHTAQP